MVRCTTCTGLFCQTDLVIDLLKRCPELRRAALPHDQPGDTYLLPFGATLARCTRLATLRLFTNGEHVRHAPSSCVKLERYDAPLCMQYAMRQFSHAVRQSKVCFVATLHLA